MDVNSSQKHLTFPLTPMQMGMFYHALATPRSGYDVEQVIGTLREPLELAAFKRAWQRLVDRHEALRMRFSFDEKGNAHQFPLKEVRLPIDERDWSDLSAQEQERLLADFLREDRSIGFDPRSDMLNRVAVFRLGESHYRFVWTWWHGILDGRARLILLKELFSFYEAFRQGEDLNLPQPRRFIDFADWLAGLDTAASEPFWRELLKGFNNPTPIGRKRATRLTATAANTRPHRRANGRMTGFTASTVRTTKSASGFIAGSASGPHGWRFPESARRSFPRLPPPRPVRSGTG